MQKLIIFDALAGQVFWLPLLAFWLVLSLAVLAGQVFWLVLSLAVLAGQVFWLVLLVFWLPLLVFWLVLSLFVLAGQVFGLLFLAFELPLSPSVLCLPVLYIELSFVCMLRFPFIKS